MSKRSRKLKKEKQVYMKAILPMNCFIGSDLPSRIHYDVRFTCERTGYEYCHGHQHHDACCKPLHYDTFKENEQAAAAYVLGLPKCPYCHIPLPHDLKPAHLSMCIKEYIKDFREKRSRESIFVQDKDISYSRQPSRPQGGVEERVVQFVEEA